MRVAATKEVSGFTLVELVVVIVILGIVAAFAAPRFFDNQTFMTRGYYEELAAALKYAQKLAVASGCPVRVAVASGGYDARQQAALAGSCDPADAGFPTAVALADGEALAGTAPAGVTAVPAVTITFDALGRTNLGGDQAIAVGPFVMTVRAGSGFVEAP
jgi:MSHA pilin protein MshC